MSNKRKIKNLRAQSQLVMVTALTTLVAALFISALLPSLLVRYVYANQQLFEQPKLLEYIPVAAFVAGAGYFVYAVLSNLARARRILMLEKEAEMMGWDDCSCGDHHHHSEDELMHEMGMMADEAMSTKKATARRKTKTTRRK